MTNHKKLIVIAGPTASGKTALAIELAKALQTVILSADARQFYREMQIGTAKPTEAELNAVQHYFINNLSIHDDYDAGKYEAEVIQLLDKLFLQYDSVILCGGSGLFIKAVTDGFDAIPETTPEVREQVQLLYAQNGLSWLQETILQKDPVYYKNADIQNPKRLLRALEVITQTGNPFSSYHKQHQHEQRSYLSTEHSLPVDNWNITGQKTFFHKVRCFVVYLNKKIYYLKNSQYKNNCLTVQ